MELLDSSPLAKIFVNTPFFHRRSRGYVYENVPLGEEPLMEEPFYRVAVDLIGPIAPVSDKGNRYILTIVDYATRYPEAIALPKIETERVAEALLEVFCRVGFPKEVLSDRGSQFILDLMQEVCRLVSISSFSPPHITQSAMGFVKE